MKTTPNTPRVDILFILYTRHMMALREYESANPATSLTLRRKLDSARRELDEALKGIGDDYPALVNQRKGYFSRFLYALRRNFR